MVSDFRIYGADADKWQAAGMSAADEEVLILTLWRFFRRRAEPRITDLPESVRFLYIATRDRWAVQKPSTYSREKRIANGRKGGLATQARNRTSQVQTPPEGNAQANPQGHAQASTTTTPTTATTSRFNPPTEEEVRSYCAEKKYSVDAEAFIAYYTSNGWKIGKSSMKNWRAALVTWNKRNKGTNHGISGNYRGQNRSNFYAEGIGAQAGI